MHVKEIWVFLVSKLNTIQSCDATAKKTKAILNNMTKSTESGTQGRNCSTLLFPNQIPLAVLHPIQRRPMNIIKALLSSPIRSGENIFLYV